MKHIPITRYRTAKAAEIAISDLLCQMRDAKFRGSTDLTISWGAVGVRDRESVTVMKKLFRGDILDSTIVLYFVVTARHEITVLRAVPNGMVALPTGRISKAEIQRRQLILEPMLKDILGDGILVEELPLPERAPTV